MRCKSVFSETVDAYSAGNEIGTALNSLQPEIVILFPSVHYYDFTDLFDGIYDGLEKGDTIIFGGTGDGFYESGMIGTIGVSAIGINSENKIRWAIETRMNAGVDSYQAARECMLRLQDKTGESIRTAMVFADGITCDGVKIVDGVKSVLSVPFIGGLTGDDRKFEKAYILVNGEIFSDSVAILALIGDFSFAVNTASGWLPTGKASHIEVCEGNVIKRIGDMSAVEFMRRQIGNIPERLLLSLFPLAVYDEEKNFLLRTSRDWNSDTGEITVFGGVEKGQLVRICQANIDDILKGVDTVLDSVKNAGFRPEGAIAISCAARKWLLGEKVNGERLKPLSVLGNIPIAGYPSYGEIGPFRRNDGTYTASFFHNETYILMILG